MSIGTAHRDRMRTLAEGIIERVATDEGLMVNLVRGGGRSTFIDAAFDAYGFEFITRDAPLHKAGALISVEAMDLPHGAFVELVTRKAELVARVCKERQVTPAVVEVRQERPTRPPREAYLRGTFDSIGLEVHLGLEWRLQDDDVGAITEALRSIARTAGEVAIGVLDGQRPHELAVAHAEGTIKQRWPDRAYFVETEHAGVGVQVYQPFGMPRNT